MAEEFEAGWIGVTWWLPLHLGMGLYVFLESIMSALGPGRGIESFAMAGSLIFRGLVQVVLGHPLDTIKVRLQAQGLRAAASYRGPFHCVSCIVRHESPLGMFKGMLSPAICITALNAIAFGVRGNVLNHLDSPTLLDHWVAGCLSGAAQLPISCPSELAKIRMQMSGVGEGAKLRGNTGSLKTIMNIYRTEGFAGCYRGLVITAMRDIPAFGLYFSCYEASRRELERHHTPELLTECLAGGSGGMASWSITYAIDSIKSRIQADGAGGRIRYTGLVDAIYLSFKHESIFDLHKGMSVALIRAFFVNAFVFSAFHYSRKFLLESHHS